jgi:perosamine synthetase
MIPLSIPDLRGREAEYLATCVRDNWISSAGPFVAAFEERIATLAERSHAVATVNGTAALHLALIGAGVRKGDHVIVPDWTFAATANAVYHAGAIPIFVDVDADSWTLDPVQLARVFDTSGSGKISAVIAVDTIGYTADMDVLAEICGRYGVALIEDAAGAIGAAYKGRPAGSFGDSAIFSFNGNKTVTAGGGGMVLTNDEISAQLMTHLSKQARTGEDYLHDAIGFNYRMTNVNAGIGLAQLERLPEMLARRREIADAYNDVLTGCNKMTAPPSPSWASPSGWLYSLLCANAGVADALVEHMRAKGIEARKFWRSLSEQPVYSESPAYLTGVSQKISGSVVSLPSSSSLSIDQLDRVIEELKAFDSLGESIKVTA